MERDELILGRYEPLGTAGAGGFGTVRVAWDPRIQRKVAIKTIELSEADARRAALPGADAVAGGGAGGGAGAGSTAGRWHGLQPWGEFLEEDLAGSVREPRESSGADDERDEGEPGVAEDSDGGRRARGESGEPVTALAHLPGLDEARTAAKLSDSRIVGVYDFEVRGQTAYLIMEYVEGLTLSQVLAEYEDWLTLDLVTAVFDAVAGALSVAHKAGVLHLDIKPDNILVDADGHVKVTDFGLATLADAAGTGTAGGGTIGYMPLEQMRREALDARTDEWALASVLYEALTGENPFRAADLAGAERAIEDAEIVVPSLCWDDIDEGIDDVVFQALDPDRERRYATVASFAKAADAFLGDADAGERELAALVSGALGVGAEDELVEEEPPERPQRAGVFGRWFGGGKGVARASRAEDDSRDGARRYHQDGGREAPGREGSGASGEAPGRGAPSREEARESRRGGRGLLAGRAIPWERIAGRAIVAAAVGYLAFFAVARVYPGTPLFGGDALGTVELASVLVVAAVGALLPPVGVLAGFLMAGFAFVVAGQVLVGAALAVVGLVWCYAVCQLVGARGAAAGGRGAHPVWAWVVAVVLVAALVAAIVFAQLPSELMMPAVVALFAIPACIVA